MMLNMQKQIDVEQMFAKRVREEREKKGWSQAEMASLLKVGAIPMDVHPSGLARLERGERVIRLREAQAIAELFGLALTGMLATADESYDARLARLVAQIEESDRAAAEAKVQREAAERELLDLADVVAEPKPGTAAARLVKSLRKKGSA